MLHFTVILLTAERETIMTNTNKSFKKFFILWSGEFISAIGSGLTAFGLGVYVFNLTGKASAMALITILAFLPPLLFGTVAGVLADRYDRRLMMILGDSLSVIGLIYILVCMFMGDAQLWQICVGVTVSSVFSSLMEPAYKATVSDLLTAEQFTKASGLVQITNSAKYLVSPIIAGYLLAVSDVKLILIIDICTFFVTVASTLVVKKGIATKKQVEKKTSFIAEFKEGWTTLTKNKGVFTLTIITSILCFSMGFIQMLSAPMILAFKNSSVLGTVETIVALGMLFSSILIGVIKIKGGYVKILSASLFGCGLMMMFFGLKENVIIIGIFGFLFFAMLPFANTSLDYLIRTNTENSVQGRIWSLIGIISQLGVVIAYAVCGVLADYIFTPMLVEGGALSGSVGKIIGTGKGRGAAFLIIIAGILMCVTSIVLYNVKSVRKLESTRVACSAE